MDKILTNFSSSSSMRACSIPDLYTSISSSFSRRASSWSASSSPPLEAYSSKARVLFCPNQHHRI